MSIGLFDTDIINFSATPFNLELMKISDYYKRRGEIVILSPYFAPEKHQKYYLRKDYPQGGLPEEFTYADNLSYGGYAFTNGIYVPLPIEIERRKADTEIYNKFEEQFCKGRRVYKTLFENLLNAQHLRLSLDGKTIWDDYKKQLDTITYKSILVFHDKNLGAIDGAVDELLSYMIYSKGKLKGPRIGMKFPVIITEGKELIKWGKLCAHNKLFNLQFDGVIDDDHFKEFVSVSHSNKIYDNLIYCATTTSKDSKEFTEKYLQQIFRQIIYARKYRVFFTIKYEDNFFFDKNWDNVMHLLNFFSRSMKTLDQSHYSKKIMDDTLIDFFVWAKKYLSNDREGLKPKEMKVTLDFIKNKLPALYEDFYTFSVRSLED